MTADSDPYRNGEPAAEGLSDHQRSRRLLLRGGAVSAPIVLTVASSPVLAGNGLCTPASSFASISASRVDVMSTCTGKYPAWWADVTNNYSFWPTAKYTKNQSFDSVLTPYASSSGKSLLQVLQFAATTGNDCVAKHIVAALLNAATGRTPAVLDEALVKSIWAQFVSNGFRYSPTPSIWWYADSSTPAPPPPMTGGINEWLKTTMV
jgi:hypothetical protein